MFLQYITQMPLLRKLAPKRRLIRRKTMMKRRAIIPRSPRQPVQFFKRSVYYSGWTANSTTTDIFVNYFGALSVLPNVSEFTSLYDQYRINGIKVTLIPRGNQSDIGTASGTVAQSVGVFSVIDYDDINPLTSLNQAMQYQNLKMTRSHQIHSRYFKPRILNSVLANAGTGAVANAGSTRGWLDVTSDNIPHMGVKFVLQQSPNSVQTFDVKIDYFLAFKNVR